MTLVTIERTSEYLFVNRFGKPFGSIKNSFKKALKKAEITDFKFHDLRHTFGTYLANNRVSEVTISELLGHSRKTITSRYIHAMDECKAEAVQIIGNICLACVSQAKIIEMK